MNRKFKISVVILSFATTFAFGQSEALKVVANSLGYYKQTDNVTFLAKAKKSIDSLIVSRRDSNNIEKSIYKGLVYATILQVDTSNKLNSPPDFFANTVTYVKKLGTHRRIKQYSDEYTFIKQSVANAYLRSGFINMDKSDYINAEKDFRGARRFAPNYKPIDAYIAYSNSRLGNLQEAAKFYNNLANTDSINTEYIQTAANVNIAIGDTVKALELLKRGRKLIPDDKFLILDEANIYNNKKDYKSLETLLPTILEDNKNNADIMFIAANCYDQLKKYDKAEQYYLKAIELNSSVFDPIFNLGLLYYKKSVTETSEEGVLKNIFYAAKWLEKAHEISPNDINCLKVLRDIYTQTNNLKQLEKVNIKIKQLNKSNL